MNAVTSNVDREVRSHPCQRHGIAFNQSRTRERSGQQWSEWYPPLCPECEVETAQELQRQESERKWNEEVFPRLKAGIIAETDKRCSEEHGRAERIAALADSQMPRVFGEWWAANRAGFIACEDSEDRMRIDAEIIAERRARFFEEQKAVADKADAELQAKLDAEREQKMKAALASFAMFG